MSLLEQWNQNFGIQNQITFTSGKGDLPIVTLKNSLGKASIALQGAHVLSFQPTGEKEVIWMSDEATFATGKSLRGGAPICWPWFGAHTDNSKLPGHGYARTVSWLPVASKQLDDGQTRISFELDHTSVAEQLQVHPLRVQLHVTVGSNLHLQLETTNLGDSDYLLSEALHTYFYVGDVRKVHIEGLKDAEYLDKMDAFARKTQHDDVTIEAETDRVYLNTGSTLRIVDAAWKRAIVLESEQADSVIVWNPWIATAQKMGDLGDDGYLKMLCVETANAADNVIALAPKSSHTMGVNYRVMAL